MPASSPAAIACPACKSKISADGKTLHEKSNYLEELLETDAGVDEIEKHHSKLGKENEELQAKIAELQGQLAEAQKKLTEKKETKPDVVQKGQQGSGARKPSWWD